MAASARANFGSLFRKCLLVERSSTPLGSTSFVCNRVSLLLSETREVSTCSAAISRIPRKVYSWKYKVRLVQPDGSSFFIRYEEPYKIITQPINPADMTEEEKKARMKRLKPEKPKKIYELDDEDEQGYDQRSWSNLMKKN
ncbi:ribosomal protein, L55 [Desmophyllum pertusum]|uniref:Ribosomal protein, L55 n=1 Tax=Desmophyllum pertusum TaxID=174260 RepID=A0A9W9YL14_9CNID|nr:ribosomal protein, L55 [Desmophyllum pertusum]